MFRIHQKTSNCQLNSTVLPGVGCFFGRVPLLFAGSSDIVLMKSQPFVILILAALQLMSCRNIFFSSGDDAGQAKVLDGAQPTTGGSVARLGDCPKYPLVFIHGFLGGNRVGNFAGVQRHFGAKGCKALVAEVSPLNGVEFRARQFADQLNTFMALTGAVKVNIIAHSQGGLDSRYLIAKLGFADKVASLSMLSTPNRGTPLADRALRAAGGPIRGIMLNSMLNLMAGVASTGGMATNDARKAVESLTTGYINGSFNPMIQDAPGVYYQSWGARSGLGTGDQMKAVLASGALYLSQVAGENDGVVPVRSARWGEFRGVVDADHMDLIGMHMGDILLNNFNHLRFLEELSSELAAKGL
jgi:triacylglycerol lipase